MSGHRLVPDRRGELFCGSYVNSEDMTTLQISHVIIWCWVALDTGLAALGIAVVRGSTILQIHWRCVEFTCQGFQSNFVVVFFEVGFSVAFPGPTTALMTYLTACCALNRLLGCISSCPRGDIFRQLSAGGEIVLKWRGGKGGGQRTRPIFHLKKYFIVNNTLTENVLSCNPSSRSDLTSVAPTFGTWAPLAEVYTTLWYLGSLNVACA